MSDSLASIGPMPARKFTDAQLAAALPGSPNMHQLLIALGLMPRGGNYETVRRRIGDLGLDDSKIRRPTFASLSDAE